MKRLFKLIRYLLIVALAGALISISTFPRGVSASTLAQVPPSPNTAPRPKIDLLRLSTGKATSTPPNTCPAQTAPPAFQPPPFETDNLTLTAAPGQYKLGNQSLNGFLYNGVYTPPTLRVKPGDTINLALNNVLPPVVNPIANQPPVEQNLEKVSQDSNLHYHGFNVSPLLGSDDVVMHVHSNDNNNPPLEDYQMNVNVPRTHQSGLFWYHPHVHTTSEIQVLGGMSGGIIVEGIEKYYPIIKGIPLANQPTTPPLTERVMLFKDFQGDINNVINNDRDFNCFTLNGLINPQMSIKPGEVQFWRIGNVGADFYLNLALQNSQQQNATVYILARDGNIVTNPIATNQPILLPPASRVELLAIGPQTGQTYNLVSLSLPPQTGTPSVLYQLATVTATKDQPVNYNTGGRSLNQYITSQTPTELDPSQPLPNVLAKLPISPAHKRTFTFAAASGNFTINNQLYDENRIDTTVQVGDIEEWTLVNATPAHHAFHIHQLDFLNVTNYNPTKPQGYQDTIDMPPCTTDSSGSCTKNSQIIVRIPFVNPIITGVYVYHCHILGHEDRGMMQNIKVIARTLPKPVRDIQ